MTKILTGIAALMIVGAAALPVPAAAVEQEQGITKAQPTDVSSQRRHYRHYRHYGHRYWGPRYRYGYYGNPYRYGYYGAPYYRRPGVALGIGPFGFGVF